MISVSDITKKFNGCTAIQGVDFEIPEGDIVGLLGPNGAGKTTTLKCILGSVIPDEGTVEIQGNPVHENKRWVHDKVGAMMEGSRNCYWRLTVKENVEFFSKLNGHDVDSGHYQRVLRDVGLEDQAETPVRKLSRGMKQKVGIANVLSQDIEVAILDEPTLGLDVEATLSLRDNITSLSNRDNLTILITSHDMSTIRETCDSIIVLNNGRVIEQGPTDEIKNKYSSQTYDLTVTGEERDEFIETIDHSHDLIRTTQSPSVTEISVSSSTRGLKRILQRVEGRDVQIESIENTSDSLQEAFMKIVEEN